MLHLFADHRGKADRSVVFNYRSIFLFVIGEHYSFFPVTWDSIIIDLISSNLARYGVMFFTPNFKISPGMPSGPMDFFLIADNANNINTNVEGFT